MTKPKALNKLMKAQPQISEAFMFPDPAFITTELLPSQRPLDGGYARRRHSQSDGGLEQ
jgi:hypothetical protein